MTLAELHNELIARGLVPAQQEPLEPPEDTTVSPWYVQTFAGLSAWLAGMLLNAFILFEFEEVLYRTRSWETFFVIGVCLCGAAAALYLTLGGKSLFAEQFALAISIAGQTQIVWGIGEKNGVTTAFWGMLFLEILLLPVMRNRLHRFLSSLGAVVGWALVMHEAIFKRYPWNYSNLPNPAGSDLFISVLLWLLVWAPVAVAAGLLVRYEARWMAKGRENVLRPVTNGLIAALSIAPLATHPGSFWFYLGSHGQTAMGPVALWPLLAALLALVAMALAFTLRNRALIGLAICFALLEISGFYYVLGTTLLVKSFIMLLLGAILVLAAMWLERSRT